MKYTKKQTPEIEAVLWDGNETSEKPLWLKEALRNFDFDSPGWIFRQNRPEGNVLQIGGIIGTEIVYPNQYIGYTIKTGYLFAISKEELEQYYLPEQISGMTKNLEAFKQPEH